MAKYAKINLKMAHYTSFPKTQSYVTVSALGLLLLLSIRLYEIVYLPFSFLLLQGLFFDVLLIQGSYLVIAPFYIASARVNLPWSRRLYRLFIAIVVVINLSLSKYYLVNGKPFGPEISHLSWHSFAGVIELFFQKFHLGDAIILILISAFLFKGFGFLSKWRRALLTKILILLAIISIPLIWVLRPSAYMYEKISDYYMTTNKFEFLIKNLVDLK